MAGRVNRFARRCWSYMTTQESIPLRCEIQDPEIGRCSLCRSSRTLVEEDLSRLLNLLDTNRRIVSCGDCGFRFMQPFLSEPEIQGLYNTESTYFDSYVSGRYLNVVRQKLPYYRQVQRLVESRMGRKGRVLDVGCATGHFLSVFKEEGWDVFGLELSDWCRAYSREHFAIEPMNGTLRQASFEAESFDVITINHVLEHLDSPLGALRRAHRWLRPKGLLCVEVPNEFNDLVFLLAGDWGHRRFYNDTKAFLHHQLFFQPKHLRQALKDSGWDILETRTSSWKAPVPCHLFRMNQLNWAARMLRKVVLMAGSLAERGEFIFCLAQKRELNKGIGNREEF